jgi:hypothetical protein
MNERIKLLAEQADNFADDKIQMPGEYHPDWHDVRDEKFAELIIEECLLMCDCAEASLLEHSYPRESDGAASVKIFIKEHFGVEE